MSELVQRLEAEANIRETVGMERMPALLREAAKAIEAKTAGIDVVFVCTFMGPSMRRFKPESFQLTRDDAEMWNRMRAEDSPAGSKFGIIEVPRGKIALDIGGEG